MVSAYSSILISMTSVHIWIVVNKGFVVSEAESGMHSTYTLLLLKIVLQRFAGCLRECSKTDLPSSVAFQWGYY